MQFRSLFTACFFSCLAVIYAPKLQAESFQIKPDTAQYKGSDYSGAIRVERGITREKALEIAESDPTIEYFFYVKGNTMLLELPSLDSYNPLLDPLHLVSHTPFYYDSGAIGMGYCRVFRHGDALFFKEKENTMWLGSAPGLADTYVKE